MRVLLVEDDPDLRLVLTTLLTVEGYEVDDAADGREALRRLSVPPLPGVVLMDWWMPVVSGEELLREMRKQPALKALPVVVISGAKNVQQTLAGRHDIRAVIEKPARLEVVLAALDRALKDSSGSAT